jgi:hypothetical protein
MPGTDIIWTVDYASGIDILAFDQNPENRPTTASVDRSWLARTAVDPLAQALRELCKAGGRATTHQHDAVRRLLG